MKGIIRVGATVCQDFKVFGWPAELSSIVFDVEKQGEGYRCKADGYGNPGNYGSGAIFVPHREDVKEVKEGESYKPGDEPVLITPDELRELSKQVANVGFEEGLMAGVEMVRLTAELNPDKAEFLMDIAAKMEGSMAD